MNNYPKNHMAHKNAVCGKRFVDNAAQGSNSFDDPGTSGIFCRRQNSRLEPDKPRLISEAVVDSSPRALSIDLKVLKQQAERMSRALKEIERQILSLEAR